MKFSDLFLPKIQRSDPESRKAAVKNSNDVNLLRQVIEKDVDPGVCREAKRRLGEIRPDMVV